MLIYRQRKLETSRTSPVVNIPDYWRAEVERLNKEDRAYRKEYFERKNQLDIEVMDSSRCFNITDDNFVSVIDG